MTIIQHKRGTSERWAELNPILTESEIGYDITLKKAKIGDGVTAWTDLPFIAGGETGEGGMSDYNELTNKPKINNVELSGNNTSTDLGLQDVFFTENPINIRVETISSTKNIAVNKDANTVTASFEQDLAINSNNIFHVYASSTDLGKKGVVFNNYIALPVDANTIYINNTNNIVLGYYLDDGSFYPKFIFGSQASGYDGALLCASITNSGNYKQVQVINLALSSAIRSGTLTRAIRIDKANNTIYLSNTQSGSTKSCVISNESYINELQKCTTVMLVSNQSTLDYGLKNTNSYWIGALKYDSTEFKIPTKSEAASLVKRYPDDAIVTRYLNLKVDNSTVKVNSSGKLEAIPQEVNVATVGTVGVVKPDGSTITIAEDGTISSTGGGGSSSIATTDTAGIVKPDGSTITVTEDGTISAAGGGTSYTFTGGLTETNGIVSVNGTNLKTDFSSFVKVNGNPTINTDYSVTNFSDIDYITCKSLIDGTEDSWEIVIPFKVNTLSNAGILDTAIGTQQFRFTLNDNGTLRFRINKDLYSNSYVFDITSTEAISTGEKVYTKIAYSSASGYSLYKSTDGLEFTQIGASNDTTKVLYNNDCYWIFGDNAAIDLTLDGTIYFKELYVRRNDDNKIYLAGNVIGLTKYEELQDKPTINGFEISGNMNPSKVNIQPLLTPKNGIEVKQDGDWHILDGSYDKATKVITFNKYNLRSSTVIGQFNAKLGGANSIGNYVDSTILKPTAGLITPFYKNVTLMLNNYDFDVIILGNYDGANFTPKVWISLVDSSQAANIYKITGITTASTIFDTSLISTTLVSTLTTVPVSRGAYIPYITMLYENNTYTFKTGWGNATATQTNRYVKTQTSQDSIFDECTHMWYIPLLQTMGFARNVKLMSGDKSLALTRRELTEEEQNTSLMSPDDTDKEYYTSISIKTDGVTTKINNAGEVEAITPANMITSDNIASDTTIVGMNDAIEMAQGNITALSTNVTTLQKQNTYPKTISVAGKMINAVDDITEGIGIATVTLYQNGICKINFSCKISTAGTADSQFTWGLKASLIKALDSNLPTITPTNMLSIATYLNTDGTYSTDNGYGGSLMGNSSSGYWMFQRIYTAEGQSGGYPSNKFVKSSILQGVAYGTFNINEVQ